MVRRVCIHACRQLPPRMLTRPPLAVSDAFRLREACREESFVSLGRKLPALEKEGELRSAYDAIHLALKVLDAPGTTAKQQVIAAIPEAVRNPAFQYLRVVRDLMLDKLTGRRPVSDNDDGVGDRSFRRSRWPCLW